MPAKMWKETSKAKLWQDWSLVINLTSHGREASVILKYHSVSRRQRMSCTGKCGGSGINITETEKAAAKHPKCLQSAVWWSTRSPLTLQWHTSFWNGYLLYLFLPEKNRKRDSRVVEGNGLLLQSHTPKAVFLMRDFCQPLGGDLIPIRPHLLVFRWPDSLQRCVISAQRSSASASRSHIWHNTWDQTTLIFNHLNRVVGLWLPRSIPRYRIKYKDLIFPILEHSS